jgi:aminoglycoside 3-N-acetyltransferase
MTIKNYISNFLIEGNVNKGDIVLIHSNISELYKNLIKENFNFSLNDVLDIFLEHIGPKGTLIFPTFNFTFCKGNFFSSKDTVSEMGSLSELARIRAGENRTWHPVYSFALFGNIPNKEIQKKNYSAYGEDSIFNWLTDVNGKISIINLTDQNSMTYYHHVEEIMNVDWRFHKNFTGDYIDFNDVKKKTTAKIFVRDISKGIKTDVKNMEKILWSKNLYKSKYLNSKKGCRSIEIKDLKKEVVTIIKTNKAKGTLYQIDS